MGGPISARRIAAIALAAFCVLAPSGWILSDRLEQNNDFCTSCHLSADVPLHIDLRQAFDAKSPGTLAALHGADRI